MREIRIIKDIQQNWQALENETKQVYLDFVLEKLKTIDEKKLIREKKRVPQKRNQAKDK